MAVAWLLLLSACQAPTNGARPAAKTTRDDGGFTIREPVRVSSSVRADFQSALELLEEQEFESGIALLVDVTEAAPTVTAPHIDLGIAYGQIGQMQHAQASFERALQLNPRHPVAHNELGIVYRNTGRFEEARRSYERALEIHPDFHFARRNLAVLCDVYIGDVACALEHYEAYQRAVPSDESVAMWIADLRRRGGQ
jgi:Flp pilus assembly protein TadD